MKLLALAAAALALLAIPVAGAFNHPNVPAVAQRLAAAPTPPDSDWSHFGQLDFSYRVTGLTWGDRYSLTFQAYGPDVCSDQGCVDDPYPYTAGTSANVAPYGVLWGTVPFDVFTDYKPVVHKIVVWMHAYGTASTTPPLTDPVGRPYMSEIVINPDSGY